MKDKGFLNNVVDNAFGILDQFVEDKDAKEKAKQEMDKLRLQAEMTMIKGQLDANIEQAKHPSIFVSGARPCSQWLIIFLLAYNYIGYSLLIYIGTFFPEFNAAAFPKPIDDTTELLYFLGAMLGLHSARSWEKGKGVARNNLSEPNQSPLP